MIFWLRMTNHYKMLCITATQHTCNQTRKFSCPHQQKTHMLLLATGYTQAKHTATARNQTLARRDSERKPVALLTKLRQFFIFVARSATTQNSLYCTNMGMGRQTVVCIHRLWRRARFGGNTWSKIEGEALRERWRQSRACRPPRHPSKNAPLRFLFPMGRCCVLDAAPANPR